MNYSVNYDVNEFIPSRILAYKLFTFDNLNEDIINQCIIFIIFIQKKIFGYDI